MKIKLIIYIITIIQCTSIKAQVAIGSSSASNDAALEVRSTNKGFLLPRMTEAERNAIHNPVAGLMVFCSNCNSGEMQYFNGTSWLNMAGGAAAVASTYETVTPVVSEYGAVGINTTTPKASAELEVYATNKGFLLPRMTQVQKNAINEPATGLMIYCTDCGNDGETQIFINDSWKNSLGNVATSASASVSGPPITDDDDTILSISNNYNITINSGAQMKIDQVSFYASSTFSMVDTQINSNTSALVSVDGESVSRVLTCSTVQSSFSGTISFDYEGVDLNNNTESELKLLTTSNNSNYQLIPSDVNTTEKTVTNSSMFDNLSFSTISLANTFTEGVDPTNIAYLKSVEVNWPANPQSTVRNFENNNFNYVPEGAVDGDKTTNNSRWLWDFQNYALPVELEIDFGDAFILTSYNLFDDENYSGVSTDFKIMYLDVNSQWVEAIHSANNASHNASGIFPNNIETAKVKFVWNSHSDARFLRIRELEVYGYLAEALSVSSNVSSDIKLYPNPVKSELTINYDAPMSVEIYDMQSRLLIETAFKHINMRELPGGIYSVQVTNEETGQRIINKVLKE